jgi:hypothetical protein
VDSSDPVAAAAVHAIRTGDTTSLASLLSQHPGLASKEIHETRTPLHVVTDWPGYFPAGPATDLETPGGSIGTPLDNAVGYGCWNVARLLLQRGARVDKLWQAAALGIMARVEEFLAAGPPPSTDDINEAFWQACHPGAGQVRAKIRDHERASPRT